MTRLLVRLKVDLLRAGLRGGGTQAKVGLGVAVAIAAIMGGSAGFLLMFGRLLPAMHRDDLVLTTASALGLGWVLFPLLFAAADGTLEADRLTPFPLTSRQMMPGLLASALVGTGGLATVLILLGLGVAAAPASPLAAVTVAALVVLLAQCGAMSRLVTTALSGAAKRRRWRDLAVFIAPLLWMTINVGFQLFSRSTRLGRRPPAWVATVGEVAQWLPTGITAQAMTAAQEGRAVAATGWLGAAALVLIGIVLAWGWTTERVLTSAPTAGTRGKARRDTGRLPLFGHLLSPLPRTRVGVVAAKEIRLHWRDPRQRVALVMPLLATLAPLIGLVGATGLTPRFVLAGAFPALVVGGTSTNAYGFDGFAHWTNVAAGDDARADLAGKVLARILLGVALSVVVGAGLAFLAHEPGALVSVLPLALCALGISMGLGLPVAVRHPVPMPDATSNIFSAGNAGGRATQGAPAMAVGFGSMILVAPFAIAALLAFGNVVAELAVGVVALAAGAAALRTGFRTAVRISERGQPELLEKLGRRNS